MHANDGNCLALLLYPRESPCVPHRKLRGTSLQFEKNQEILPSMRVEALIHCSVPREIPPSLLSPERSLTPLRKLKKFPDILVCTQEEHRGSRHNSRRAPDFPPHLEMRVDLPFSSGKESQRSRHTSRRGGLSLTLKRNSRGRANIQKAPEVPVHSRHT